MRLIDSLLGEHPVSIFIEAKSAVESLSNHFRRTSNPLMRKYVGLIREALDAYSKHPADGSSRSLIGITTDCQALLKSSQLGERDKFAAMLPNAYKLAREYKTIIESYHPANLASSGLVEDTQYEDEHSEFCRKFCREFKVKCIRDEKVAEGLFVYFDRPNTALLQQHPYFNISTFCFENDYILLKAGTVDDFSFGSFGEDSSKWNFVYVGNQ